MPSQSRKPHTQSTARLTAAHHRPRTEAKTSHSQAHPHQTSSARSPFPCAFTSLPYLPNIPTYLPTDTVRPTASKGGGRSGTAALPCRRRRPSSPRGCCGGRPPSCCTASSASASRPLAAPLPIRSNRIGVGNEAAIRLYEGGSDRRCLPGKKGAGAGACYGSSSDPRLHEHACAILSCCGRRTNRRRGGG